MVTKLYKPIQISNCCTRRRHVSIAKGAKLVYVFMQKFCRIDLTVQVYASTPRPASAYLHNLWGSDVVAMFFMAKGLTT